VEIAIGPEGAFLLLDGGARRIAAESVPESLVSIFVAGGLVPYLAKHRRFAPIA
jgi:hypothetical protein